MREHLLTIVQEFNQGLRPIEQLQKDLVALKKQGIEECLNEHEVKRFKILLSGWVDMYDSKFQPHAGFFGHCLDILDQVFRGNYRITIDQVREKTTCFEKFLARKD